MYITNHLDVILHGDRRQRVDCGGDGAETCRENTGNEKSSQARDVTHRIHHKYRQNLVRVTNAFFFLFTIIMVYVHSLVVKPMFHKYNYKKKCIIVVFNINFRNDKLRLKAQAKLIAYHN
jgi:hypothetical protein